MNLGNNIKYLRQRKNLTQTEVGNRLGVSSQAVSKWETNANTPDISLLPEIASIFDVSIDALFLENIESSCYISDIAPFVKDDDIIRVFQMQGKKLIKVSSAFSPDDPPIEIEFPHDCNERTGSSKVEIYGHIISDSSINGDVVCYQGIHCSQINGNVRANGDIRVNELNSQSIICNNIADCYKINAKNIECAGKIESANLTCDQVIYKS